MAVTKPRFDFPRSVSYEAEAHENLAPILRRDIGVFWDLRRSHLGLETINSVESMVLALRYRTSLLREFCTEWLGLGGLNVLVKIAVVCDLPSGAALEVQRQHIIRAFDDLQMQFCNVEGSLHVPMARREGMSRFVTQFINEYPNPLLVVVSDDLRILQSVRHISGDAIIIPIISRSKHDRRSDGQNRRFFNRILADNIALHPWDVYFYETIMLVTLKGWRYPKNCLDLLYSSKHDNVTAKEPLLAWLVSLLLQTFTVSTLRTFVFSSTQESIADF